MKLRASPKAIELTASKTLLERSADLAWHTSGQCKRHFAFREKGNFSVEIWELGVW